jgi:hypothetical protein
MRNQAGNDATANPGIYRIGPTGQHNWHPRSQHNAGRLRLAEKLELLGQHIAAFDVWHNQNVCNAGNW